MPNSELSCFHSRVLCCEIRSTVVSLSHWASTIVYNTLSALFHLNSTTFLFVVDLLYSPWRMCETGGCVVSTCVSWMQAWMRTCDFTYKTCVCWWVIKITTTRVDCPSAMMWSPSDSTYHQVQPWRRAVCRHRHSLRRRRNVTNLPLSFQPPRTAKAFL